jgi:hypothetical protein
MSNFYLFHPFENVDPEKCKHNDFEFLVYCDIPLLDLMPLGEELYCTAHPGPESLDPKEKIHALNGSVYNYYFHEDEFIVWKNVKHH